MKKTLKLTIACGLILMLGACSSSQTTEGEEGLEDQEIPGADAGTDALPMEGAENTAIDGGGELPPADMAEAPPPPMEAAPDPAALNPPPPTEAPPAVASDSGAVGGSGMMEDYTVQAGDTLMKIAFETYGDLYRWRSILDANRDKISDPSMIAAGTVLKIEKPSTPVSIEKNGERYLIKAGDTLGSISNDVYGTRSRWKELWENNRQMIRDPNRIFAGFYLYYQGGSAPSTATTPMADAAPALSVPDPGMETSRAPSADGSTPPAGTADAPPPADAGAPPADAPPAG